MNKRVQKRSIMTFILSIIAMIAMVLLGGKTTAQEAGGSELSLDNVTVTSFKITDVTNGNREILSMKSIRMTQVGLVMR